MNGDRVTIPTSLRQTVLEILHILHIKVFLVWDYGQLRERGVVCGWHSP